MNKEKIYTIMEKIEWLTNYHKCHFVGWKVYLKFEKDKLVFLCFTRENKGPYSVAISLDTIDKIPDEDNRIQNEIILPSLSKVSRLADGL